MKRKQYTIRGVPERLDNVAKEQARKYGKSLNTLLLESIARGLGTADEEVVFDDMDELAGTWVEDKEFDEAISAFDSVDEELWK